VTLRRVKGLELISYRMRKGNLVTDFYSIVAKWRNHFFQLLNVRRVNGLRQTEIHTAEPLVPELSVFKVEVAEGKLKATNHEVLIKSQQN